jgi:hypothetical protein
LFEPAEAITGTFARRETNPTTINRHVMWRDEDNQNEMAKIPNIDQSRKTSRNYKSEK